MNLEPEHFEWIQPFPSIAKGDIVDGDVWRVFRVREDDLAIGLLVNIGACNAFVPRSLVPLDRRWDLSSLIGQWMMGVVINVDESRRNVVVAPRYFGEYIPPLKSNEERKEVTIPDDYLQLLLDNLRENVPSDDRYRYLGRKNAKRILVALVGQDCGDDADDWERLICSLRPT